MKRNIFIVIIGLVILGSGFLLNFYWSELRGIWPAVSIPSGDIVELIEESEVPLNLPEGFSVSIFASGLINPRVMMYGPDGNLWVTVPSEGKVISLKDTDGDGKAETHLAVAENLNRPHGLAFRCLEKCQVYVAETDQVAVYDFDEINSKLINKKKLLSLPSGGNHFTRTIMFMPVPDEDRLLISVGSSCNVCNESDSQRAKVLSMNFDGTDVKEFSRGLRNSVFMAIHPVNGKIWATEMGRDLLGDNLPPDEINILEEGANYGWPVCYGKNIHDTEFDKNTYIRNPCMEPFEKPSHIDIPAHSAPLGLAFIPEEGWPQEFWYNALVAYHGSWNRSIPDGYKVVRYKLDQDGNYLGDDSAGSPQGEDFISGWLKDGKALGRPADILIQPGGTILISDDKAGVIYKVLYRQPDYSKKDVSDLIRVTTPKNNDFIKSPLTIIGEARGFWYFEASFPVKLLDANGKQLAIKPAQAKGEWMTESFVPFEVSLEFEKPTTADGSLILQRDNPSGLPENDRELRIPIRFK